MFVPFATANDLIAASPELDLIVFCAHRETTFEPGAVQDLTRLSATFPKVSILLLSRAEDALDLNTFKSALKLGLRGLIPTRTTSIMLTVAAIHFVKAGGTFAAEPLLLGGEAEAPKSQGEHQLRGRFTSRQVAVLSHMARGRANKIIAHELQMSESTVKVHVRNIMRRVGASNRTEAVYKSRQILSQANLAGCSTSLDSVAVNVHG